MMYSWTSKAVGTPTRRINVTRTVACRLLKKSYGMISFLQPAKLLAKYCTNV